MKTIPATELKPGDQVIGPFHTKTVYKVVVRSQSIADEHDIGRYAPGVYVLWENRSQTVYKLNSQLDVHDENLGISCKSCSGVGRVTETHVIELGDLRQEYPVTRQCKTCNGYGLLGPASDPADTSV